MVAPVVIVPGILGSVLGYVQKNGRFKRVWYDQLYILSHGPGDMQLAPNGSDPGPLNSVGPLSASHEVPDWGPYRVLVQSLQAQGFDPDFWGYDWRLSIRTNAIRFADYLVSTYAGQDFRVIAHSMGGLVSRMAFPLVHAAGIGGRWKRTVYVGTPQYGSHQAAQYLAKPDQTLPMYGKLMVYLAGPVFIFVVNKTVEWYNDQARQTVVSWPSLYELLPSISGIWQGVLPNDVKLYDKATYADQNVNVSQTWLDWSKGTRTLIDATLTQPRTVEVSVIADKTDTPDGLKRPNKVGDADAYTYGSGDGAVVDERAVLQGATTGLLMSVAPHADQLADNRFLGMLSVLLSGADTATVNAAPIPQGVQQVVPTQLATIETVNLFPSLQRRGDP